MLCEAGEVRPEVVRPHHDREETMPKRKGEEPKREEPPGEPEEAE